MDKHIVIGGVGMVWGGVGCMGGPGFTNTFK